MLNPFVDQKMLVVRGQKNTNYSLRVKSPKPPKNRSKPPGGKEPIMPKENGEFKIEGYVAQGAVDKFIVPEGVEEWTVESGDITVTEGGVVSLDYSTLGIALLAFLAVFGIYSET